MPAFENRLTPVRKLNRTCASQSLMVAYSPRSRLRLRRASWGSSRASRIGLSYSSTRTTTPRPARSCNVVIRRRRRTGALAVRTATPARSS